MSSIASWLAAWGGQDQGGCMSCSLHDVRFDLATAVWRIGLANCRAIITRDARVSEGWIEVALSVKPAKPPEM